MYKIRIDQYLMDDFFVFIVTPPMKNEIINLVKEQEMRDAQALHERELMGHSK